MYQVLQPSRSVWVPLRQHNHHLRIWGEPQPGQALLWMLHGWMDLSASFQFLVDALGSGRCVVAPDWRGFGLTRPLLGGSTPGEPAPVGAADHHVFADYLGDLDMLIAHVQSDWQHTGPVDLLGHSMGGNLAMLYAGVRPEVVRRLINVEGFGLPPTRAAQAPGRYRRWLDELREHHMGPRALAPYPNAEAVAKRLVKNNPRLAPERAAWLATHWALEGADGLWRIRGDAAHKLSSAQLYRADEIQAVHEQISAPVLVVEAEDDSLAQWWRGAYTREQHRERLAHLSAHGVRIQTETLPDCGHMLHHDQPEALAHRVAAFLAHG